jgi:hypothetical protein
LIRVYEAPTVPYEIAHVASTAATAVAPVPEAATPFLVFLFSTTNPLRIEVDEVPLVNQKPI